MLSCISRIELGNTIMAFWNKKHTLLNAVDDWVDRNVINPTIANSLRLDVNENIPTRSFAYIPILLGVICLAFGFVTFVAANWDAMSSFARVVLLIVSLLASWVVAIYLMVRGPNWAAQLFVLLACSIFGASIMLIAQIYHMQGEPRDAVWLWAAGTILAAVLTRSSPALALGVILITLWLLMDYPLFSRRQELSFEYLIYWVVCSVIAWWFASRFTAHLLMIGLAIWILVSALSTSWFFILNVVLLIGFFGIAALLLELDLKAWLNEFEKTAIAYLFLIVSMLQMFWFLTGGKSLLRGGSVSFELSSMTVLWLSAIICLLTVGFAVYAYLKNVEHRYDIVVSALFAFIALVLLSFFQFSTILIAIFMLATQVWIIRMGWRLEYRPYSVIGFLGFALAMLFIYFKTMGSLMNTSLFYFGAGLILVIGAIVLPKVLKKWGATS